MSPWEAGVGQLTQFSVAASKLCTVMIGLERVWSSSLSSVWSARGSSGRSSLGCWWHGAEPVQTRAYLNTGSKTRYGKQSGTASALTAAPFWQQMCRMAARVSGIFWLQFCTMLKSVLVLVQIKPRQICNYSHVQKTSFLDLASWNHDFWSTSYQNTLVRDKYRSMSYHIMS